MPAYLLSFGCRIVCSRIDCLASRSRGEFRGTSGDSPIHSHYKFSFARPSGAVHLDQSRQTSRSKASSLRGGVPGQREERHYYCSSSCSWARFRSDDRSALVSTLSFVAVRCLLFAGRNQATIQGWVGCCPNFWHPLHQIASLGVSYSKVSRQLCVCPE